MNRFEFQVGNRELPGSISSNHLGQRRPRPVRFTFPLRQV